VISAEEFTELRSDIRELGNKIDKVAEDVSAQKATCEATQVVYARTNTAVYGNGEGLLSRVRTLEDHDETREKWSASKVAFLSATGGGLLLILFQWLLKVI